MFILDWKKEGESPEFNFNDLVAFRITPNLQNIIFNPIIPIENSQSSMGINFVLNSSPWIEGPLITSFITLIDDLCFPEVKIM